MKSIIQAITMGIITGLVIIFFLMFLLGTKMHGSTGTVTQSFLGLPVLESTKTVLQSGGSSVEMKPIFGIVVPLLSPALLFLVVHLIVRFSKKTQAGENKL